jgi:hypothetical protein
VASVLLFGFIVAALLAARALIALVREELEDNAPLNRVFLWLWLCACLALFVWGSYPFPSHCDWNYCSVYAFGGSVGEEEEMPSLLDLVATLGLFSLGAPTIIFGAAAATYLAARAINRRMRSN